ncbi:MAG: penicillin acylase family protein [Oligoflexia bacterium]|nr:penicillin acylase family protein [Oligoflexia bacterium]
MKTASCRGFALVLFLFSALSPQGARGAGEAAQACDLWRDEMGIPHVRARSNAEVFACLGYAHGRDRAWQMDFLRRTAQGRLAELLGPKSVRSDFLMRIMGLPLHAGRIFAELSPEARATFEEYARGANRGIQDAISAGDAYEFRDFGYQPEPWKAEDSLTIILLQSFDQTRKTFGERISQAEGIRRYGVAAEDLLKGDGLPWDTAILKDGEYPKGDVASPQARPEEASVKATRAEVAGADERALADALRELFAGYEELGLGSNNWVLAPARSASGKAWLANDPHLALRYPPFWHWSHITGPGLDVIGATLPGVPAIVSGANRTMAWGLTNSYLDVSDAHLVPDDEVRGAVSERPWIWVKFWKLKLPFFFNRFERTREGWPILPKPDSLAGAKGKTLIVRWTGFATRAEDFENMTRIMTARTAAEMDAILSKTGIPSWNFVFADSRGAIGYRVIGRAPRVTTKPRPSYGVVELANGALPEWRMRTPAEMPAVLTPKRGFIVTANNRQWPVDALDFGGRAYSKGFRAFRIEERLLARERHDFESQRQIQCDAQAVDARFLLAPLLKVARAGESPRSALAVLIPWLEEGRFDAGPECQACPVYRLWLTRIFEKTGLGENGLYRALVNGAPVAGLDERIREALKEAALELELDLRVKSWGELHLAPFAHLAGDGYRAGTAIATPGDEQSVSPGTSDWQEGRFRHRSGASMRLLVELADPPVLRLALPGSNQDLERSDAALAASPWKRWSRCEYEPVSFPLDWERLSPGQLTRIALE